ncbi:hypothetical protein QOZ80_7AG0572490 [Eleusine coracana subsp. coracana]|nr:hypothetical protein QOZ80_7AG0572490 [Eleusine coracana subsp. coracana]
MGNEAKKFGTGRKATPALHLPDDTIADILLRVSTSSAEEDIALDALPVSSNAARRLIRFPNNTSSGLAHRRRSFLASCNGVLLFFKATGHYLLCNPITRQWAELHGDYSNNGQEYAFYFHQPSGEFRLLCHSYLDTNPVWFIVSTGAAQPRRLNMSSEADKIGRSLYDLYGTATTPVALHGNLHWPPHQGLVVVETGVVAETFHRKRGPRKSSWVQMKLFEMAGQLVVADFRKHQMRIDLWFLEDYSAARWERRHRVASPWEEGIAWPDLRSAAATAVGW